MKIFTKSLLIIVGLMLVLGIGLSVAGLAMGKREGGFSRNYNQRSRVVCDDKNMEQFDDIKVNFDFGEIVLQPSDSYGLKIESSLEDEYIEYKNENGTLTVYVGSNNKQVGFFNFDFSWLNRWLNGDNGSVGSESVVVYYPENAEFDMVNLISNAGEVIANDFTARDVIVDNDFGSVRLSDIAAQTTNVKMSSGSFDGANITTTDFEFNNDFGSSDFKSFQAENAKMDMSSGTLRIDDSTFGTLDADSDFGSVKIKNTSTDKVILKCSSGEIRYSGHIGEADIQSDFGEVTLELDQSRTDYSLDLATDFGKVNVDGKKYSGGVSDGLAGKPLLKVNANSGDVSINFNK